MGLKVKGLAIPDLNRSTVSPPGLIFETKCTETFSVDTGPLVPAAVVKQFDGSYHVEVEVVLPAGVVPDVDPLRVAFAIGLGEGADYVG